MKGTKNKDMDYFNECGREIQIALKKLIKEYHLALNVNDDKTVHDNYRKGYIYSEKKDICHKLHPHSNFFKNIEDLNGSAIKGTPIQETFNKEFEKIEPKRKAKVLKGLAYLSALYQFDDYWDEQDDIRYNRNNNSKDDTKSNISISIRRQAIAIHYILEHLQVSNIAGTAEARFVQLLTGKEKNNPEIRNTQIYQCVLDPFGVTKSSAIKDLEFVRQYFDKVGLQRIVEEIDQKIIEINKRK